MQNNSNTRFIEKLPSLKESVKLSAVEKQAMRSTLANYADLHEVMSLPQTSSSRISVYSFFFSRAFVAGTLIFVLIIGSGAGVTYAAGNSLPGQPLYAVKVDVAEPIEGALITSPTGQADWQNTLAERRLSEATTLAAQNDLSTSTQEYLEQQATIHIDQSEQDSDSLAASGNTDAALAVRSDLEARLSAHSKVLALLDSRLKADGDATTTSEVAMLLEKVSQAQSTVSLSREASEVAISDTGAPSVEVNVTETTSESTSTSAGPVEFGAAMIVRTTASTTAATPKHRAAIAFVQAENSKRYAEEAQLFAKDALALGLLPLTPPATTTATSTATSTETSSTTTSTTTDDLNLQL